ncbi:transposase, partial [Gordonia sp. DT30]|uniref:transposase n=1 Tax=Gordonia sp. DT30 TaxID=3416546 RepID=UPI003CEE0EAC
NTTADHITVLHQALESLPQDYRPTPGVGGRQKILVRSDSAGATHGFAAACREVGVEFSFGFAVDHRVRDAVEHLNATAGWMPAIDSDGEVREGAWIGEATDLVCLRSWPAGTRLLLRKERPHPGAQLNFTDS